MDISQLVQTIIFWGLLFLLVLFGFLVFLYKKDTTITIIKKRVTNHMGFNQWRSKTISVPHYIIDCKLSNSSKIKTLTCSMDMYNKFKVGKEYHVLLGFNEVKKYILKSLDLSYFEPPINLITKNTSERPPEVFFIKSYEHGTQFNRAHTVRPYGNIVKTTP